MNESKVVSVPVSVRVSVVVVGLVIRVGDGGFVSVAVLGLLVSVIAWLND